ncbi:MAG TPA: SigB/SigF/SigG family RNA polymerase sigma factor [Solirubrobacteraceae bacterium]
MPTAALGSTEFSSDEDLLIAYRREGQQWARTAMIERSMPLARRLAMRYRHSEEPLEDLVQVACLGLVKAVDGFDPERANRFTSYAIPTILGELKRHFRDKGWAVHVPRDLQEQALVLGRESERLARAMGRSPAVHELAESLNWSDEQVLEASEVLHSYHAASLDAPASRDAEESATLVEALGSEDDGFALADSRQLVSQAWRNLPELERTILTLRFFHDLPQRRIAELVGYSQMHVSRLLRRGLASLLAAAEE